MLSSSWTAPTPGADQAARSASCLSAQEWTLPRRITLSSETVTLTWLASSSAARWIALSIDAFTSPALTWGFFKVMRFVTPLRQSSHARRFPQYPADTCSQRCPVIGQIVPFANAARSSALVGQTKFWNEHRPAPSTSDYSSRASCPCSQRKNTALSLFESRS
jgi:hypothetical protein